MARAIGPRKIHRYSDEFKATAVNLSTLGGRGDASALRAATAPLYMTWSFLSVDIVPFGCYQGAV